MGSSRTFDDLGPFLTASGFIAVSGHWKELLIKSCKPETKKKLKFHHMYFKNCYNPVQFHNFSAFNSQRIYDK